MRVLHILTRLIRGGADEAVVLTVAGLGKCGVSATLLVGGDSDPSYFKEISEQIPLLYEPFLRRNVSPFSDLWALYRLYTLIKQGRYDIVHTNTAKAGILGRIAAKLAGAPIIVHTIHGVTFHDFRHPLVRKSYILFEKIAARYTDHFIAVGNDLRTHYIRHGIGRDVQYTVIHTGMNLERFFAAGRSPKAVRVKKREEFRIAATDPVIGVVSRLDSGKGQQYLLHAAPHILSHYPHTKFVFAGDGQYRQTFEQIAKDLGIEEHVIFTGFRHDIEEIMAIFDIAVMTSLWEGLPRVVVQYAAVGKPVVAFDIQGVSELVRNGINGMLIPVKDIDKLVEAMITLLKHPEKAKKMGIKGRQLLDESWQSDVMVEQIFLQYQELMRQTRLPYV